MKTSSLLIFLIFLVIPLDCIKCSGDGCIDSTVPEINFGLLLGGKVSFIKTTGTGGKEVDVTSTCNIKKLKMEVYKVYCDERENGPFTTEFNIESDGILIKGGPGYMSYRMDNTLDYMRINCIVGDKQIGTHCIYYNEFESSDKDNAYVYFTLKATVNDGIPSHPTSSYTVN